MLTAQDLKERMPSADTQKDLIQIILDHIEKRCLYAAEVDRSHIKQRLQQPKEIRDQIITLLKKNGFTVEQEEISAPLSKNKIFEFKISW